jgi:hypothetical protein
MQIDHDPTQAGSDGNPNITGPVGGAAARALIMEVAPNQPGETGDTERTELTVIDKITIRSTFTVSLAESLEYLIDDIAVHPDLYRDDVPDIEDAEWAFLNNATRSDIEGRIERLNPFRPGITELELEDIEHKLEVLYDRINDRIKELTAVSDEDRAKIEEAEEYIKEKGVKLVGLEQEQGDFEYERAINNDDILKFLDGKEVDITEDFFELTDGTRTNILSMDLLKAGRYSANARYLIIRVFVGKMLYVTGSRDEQATAMGFIDNLRSGDYGSVYDGSDQSTLQADTQYVRYLKIENEIYASGSYKPEANTGRGVVRQEVKKYADDVPESVKEVIFERGKKFTTTQKVKLDENGDAIKNQPRLRDYSELNETGRSHIDLMVKWLHAIYDGKGGQTAIQALEGKDFSKLIRTMKVFKAIQEIYDGEGPGPDKDTQEGKELDAALKMLRFHRGSVKKITDEIRSIILNYNVHQTSHLLRKGEAGKELGWIMAEIAGITGRMPDRDWVPDGEDKDGRKYTEIWEEERTKWLKDHPELGKGSK